MPLFYNNKHLSMKDLINIMHNVTDISEGPFYTLHARDVAESALRLALRGASNIIIRDKRGIFQGILTNRDVLDFLGGGEKHKHFISSGLKVPVMRILGRKREKEWQIHKDESVLGAFIIFRRFGRDSHAITSQGEIYGIITERDFLKYINRPMGITISEIMSSRVFSVPEEMTISEAAKMICRGAFRKLPVTKNGIVTGVVGPYDIISYAIRRKSVKSIKSDKIPVSKVMNRWVSTISGNLDVYDAAKIMKSKKLSFLPVTYDGELEGIVTAHDIINKT